MSDFENVPADCDHEHKDFKRKRGSGLLLMIVCKICGAILFMRPTPEAK